ncbi:hypothetical protein RvY_08237-1 [Ramazzottius varieornatus]|uniref:Uncharacterized protein n=1 Tax=Ramazzottius varieornatus TaxID=947166 RepID=A0A1D1V587_RAMVA|nr:hypothetical protein RvY_08237-1 [Ramazzottius varieornatus]
MSCGWQAFTHCCSGSRSCGSSRHMQVPWTPTAGSSSQGGPAPSGEPSGGGKSETPSRFSGCSVHGFSSRGSAAFRGIIRFLVDFFKISQIKSSIKCFLCRNGGGNRNGAIEPGPPENSIGYRVSLISNANIRYERTLSARSSSSFLPGMMETAR